MTSSLAKRFMELQGMYSDEIEDAGRYRDKRKWPYFAAAGLAVAVGVGAYFLEKSSEYRPAENQTEISQPKKLKAEMEMKKPEQPSVQDYGKQIQEMSDELRKLKTKYHESQNQLETLRGYKERCNKLEAEIERLRKKPEQSSVQDYRKQIEELSDEIEMAERAKPKGTALQTLKAHILKKMAGRDAENSGKTVGTIPDNDPDYRNAAKIINSTYSEFASLSAEVVGDKQSVYPILTDELYNKTLRLFDGVESPKLNCGEVISIMKEKKIVKGTGLYLSALLNATTLDKLVIEEFPELEYIGYRIAKGKTLVLGKKTRAKDVGRFGEGNVLNWGEVDSLAYGAKGGFQGNWGKVSDMANYAKGGFQSNWGTVGFGSSDNDKYIGSMADGAKGGFQGNWGNVRGIAGSAKGGFQGNWGKTNSMATITNGGFQGNWGKAEYIALNSRGGFQGNWGIVTYIMAAEAEGGIQGNWGNIGEPTLRIIERVVDNGMAPGAKGGIQLNAGTIKNYIDPQVRNIENDKKLAVLERELNSKIGEIDFLKDLKHLKPDKVGEIQEKIRGYDFGKFEKEVLRIAGLMETHIKDECMK